MRVREVEIMEKTLKITNVLSDPTRYYIYQYITKRHSDVTVQEIADTFEIHPNVARLHLTKLEDVNMLISETKKTGQLPSRHQTFTLFHRGVIRTCITGSTTACTQEENMQEKEQIG